MQFNILAIVFLVHAFHGLTQAYVELRVENDKNNFDYQDIEKALKASKTFWVFAISESGNENRKEDCARFEIRELTHQGATVNYIFKKGDESRLEPMNGTFFKVQGNYHGVPVDRPSPNGITLTGVTDDIKEKKYKLILSDNKSWLLVRPARDGEPSMFLNLCNTPPDIPEKQLLMESMLVLCYMCYLLREEIIKEQLIF